MGGLGTPCECYRPDRPERLGRMVSVEKCKAVFIGRVFCVACARTFSHIVFSVSSVFVIPSPLLPTGRMAARQITPIGQMVNLTTEPKLTFLRWRPLLPSYSKMLPLEIIHQLMLRERYMMMVQVMCVQPSTSVVARALLLLLRLKSAPSSVPSTTRRVL